MLKEPRSKEGVLCDLMLKPAIKRSVDILSRFAESQGCQIGRENDGRTDDAQEPSLRAQSVFIPRDPLIHLEEHIANGEQSLADDLILHLRYCFLTEYYHKVTVICNHGNEGLERILTGAGFLQEAVLRDEVRGKNGFEDAGLYAMLSYEYPKYNICFVPFERGVAMVSGGQDFIDSVKLFHYGQKIEEPFADNIAGALGLLDGNGGLKRNDDGVYNLDEDQLKYLPDELAKAYTELREYFDSMRAGFDINVRFSIGTPFQKKVWNALNTIPYGATASYEDIALILTDGNIKEARKITRAVGSACSDNPVAVIVPCHRVIGKDGSIVGYSAGIDIKDYLLLHESFTAVTPLISKEG